jgi:hypothetical protein
MHSQPKDSQSTVYAQPATETRKWKFEQVCWKLRSVSTISNMQNTNVLNTPLSRQSISNHLGQTKVSTTIRFTKGREQVDSEAQTKQFANSPTETAFRWPSEPTPTPRKGSM